MIHFIELVLNINLDYGKDRRAIADFYDIKDATSFIEELTGLKVDVYSY